MAGIEHDVALSDKRYRYAAQKRDEPGTLAGAQPAVTG